MRNGTLLPDLLNSMDRFFADLSSYPASAERALWGRFAMCDIEETDQHYRLHFDMPGIKREDVTIELNGRDLRIAGERKFAQEESDKKNFHLRERAWGRFERRFQLSEQADLDKVEAQFQDGVLTITIQKKQSLKPRMIEVK